MDAPSKKGYSLQLMKSSTPPTRTRIPRGEIPVTSALSVFKAAVLFCIDDHSFKLGFEFVKSAPGSSRQPVFFDGNQLLTEPNHLFHPLQFQIFPAKGPLGNHYKTSGQMAEFHFQYTCLMQSDNTGLLPEPKKPVPFYQICIHTFLKDFQIRPCQLPAERFIGNFGSKSALLPIFPHIPSQESAAQSSRKGVFHSFL